MSQYLNRIEPEDVRFLMDLSELKQYVVEMLGEAKDLVQIEISYDQFTDAYDTAVIRPMVKLEEISDFTEENRHTLLSTGFSIDREPYDNGDFAMEQIFGQEYTIVDVNDDADGAFFTIEMPYHHFVSQKES
ncbi:hypothetical protein [Halobacillus mangrovi]|uniref:Uncharacterized protein n=1 Tax=Halobacillus mangrovi TaxID=402384 RepID=A0A1W5ZYU5_9BACI|nr:hypothetical protein [Halobacillus mangrovi]ARI78397.1 hypothetical protein HM131_16835 [Halobacillus mangrovi]